MDWTLWVFARWKVRVAANQKKKKKKSWQKCYFATNYMKPRWIPFSKAACDTNILLSLFNWGRTCWRDAWICCTFKHCVKHGEIMCHMASSASSDSLAKGTFTVWKLFSVPMQHCTLRSAYLIFTHEAKYEKRWFTPKTVFFLLICLWGYFQHRSQILFKFWNLHTVIIDI